jgi:hypothetical protein
MNINPAIKSIRASYLFVEQVSDATLAIIITSASLVLGMAAFMLLYLVLNQNPSVAFGLDAVFSALLLPEGARPWLFGLVATLLCGTVTGWAQPRYSKAAGFHTNLRAIRVPAGSHRIPANAELPEAGTRIIREVNA